jgi:hypothetical protein
MKPAGQLGEHFFEFTADLCIGRFCECNHFCVSIAGMMETARCVPCASILRHLGGSGLEETCLRDAEKLKLEFAYPRVDVRSS